MARYLVMQKGDDAAGAQFIRDAFSVPALVVPHIWLLFYRQWLAAAAVIGVLVLASLAAWHFSAPLLVLGADAIISVYVALEGSVLRIATMERDGWQEAAVVEADNVRDAEIRYFGALPEQAAQQAPVLASAFGRTSSNAFAFPARN